LPQIEGRNPVREALRAGRPVRRIFVAEGAVERGALGEILSMARNSHVRVERRPRKDLDARAQSRAHQGVLAEVDEYRFRSWHEGLDLARARGEAPMLLALDGITDPQNLGSLLRSAEVFGAHAVIVSSRHSAPITAVVEKAAAGAVEHLVIDRVSSLERALADCRKQGLWIVGLTGDAPSDLRALELIAEPLVLVIGSEGRGLSRLIRERADQLARIPMTGRTTSLNAAIAGAIALYEARAARSRT
jgi:23S rRNA (guanosine2251-2'-O)-methyltransferase